MNGPAHFASLDFIAPLSRDRAQRVANRLAVNEPAVLLDIGCGWGELLMQVVAQTGRGSVSVSVSTNSPWNVDEHLRSRRDWPDVSDSLLASRTPQ